MEAIAQVPKTALDVFRMLPEGTLCEVINNQLYMSPAPNFNHQDVVTEIITQLRTFTNKQKLGKALVSPVDVYLEKLLSAVQPDIIFISNDRMHIARKDGIYGAPDLVVEVLSPDKKRDTIMKKELYEKSGVREYFIIDPSTKQLTRFDNNAGSFIKGYESTGTFNSEILSLEFSF